MLERKSIMTIGALAKAAGIGVETVRYYQRRGLMKEPEKPFGGIRRYDEQAFERLHFIHTAQWLGFSLNEVGELLRLQDGAHCHEARALGKQKLMNVREKISSLVRIEHVLDGLIKECSSHPESIDCPLTSSLYKGRKFSQLEG